MTSQLDSEHAANDFSCFYIYQSIRITERLKSGLPIKEPKQPEMPTYDSKFTTYGMFGAAAVLTAIAYMAWSAL